MLEKLSFTLRIMLPPTLAAVAFVALAVTTQVYSRWNANQLERVEDGVYPTLVLVLNLEAMLTGLHQTLVDAGDAREEEFLSRADSTWAEVLERLDEAKSNRLVNLELVTGLETQLNEYYRLGKSTARRKIREENGVSVADDTERMIDRYNALRGTLAALGRDNRSDMGEAFAHIRSLQQRAFVVSLVVSVLSLVLVGWVSYRILGNVRTLTEEVTGSATQINSSASQVLKTSRQHEKVAHQHASAIEATRATLQSLAESSQSIAKLAQAVLENAQQTLQTHQEIAERNDHLTGHLEGISAILEAVKEIATKSELLALNAALEGTKAGEAGRGFSLVAARMQRLAENVMGNVRDIQRLTQDVHDSSHAAVRAIAEGTRLAEQTTQSARQIHAVTQTQESAAAQVTASMGDASVQVQRSVGTVQESTQAMESLVHLASQLNELLRDLKLMNEQRVS